MSISAADFHEACRVFALVAARCGRHGTAWEDVQVQRREHDETFLRITKKLRRSTADERDDRGASEEEKEDVVDDGRDEGELLRARSLAAPLVLYDVVHSPSYQVPVLYVTFQHLLQPGLPSLERIYELLVPAEFPPQLRAVGVMGSLSFAEHPITGVPAYFVHPCRTADAMSAVVRERNVTPEEYLLAWTGIVGACVGLQVSTGFAQEIAASRHRS
nr:ubiquitin-like-conjugating enzyme atg10 [Quercus suber]